MTDAPGAVGVDLDVTMPDGRQARVTAEVQRDGDAWKGVPHPLGERYEVTVVSMRPDAEHPDQSRVVLAVADRVAGAQGTGGGEDVLLAEASVKPWINLVWCGVLVLLLGFLVTIVRRAREAALPPSAE
jgi:hypothetical protein